MKYTSAWRGTKGEIYFRPLVLEPKKNEEFFDGYTYEEFHKLPRVKELFLLPVELIEAAYGINQNNQLASRSS